MHKKFAILTALSFLIICISKTDYFGFYYDYEVPKRIAFAVALVVLSVLYFIKGIPLKIPKDKIGFFMSGVVVLLLTLSVVLNKKGAFMLGLSQVSLFFLAMLIFLSISKLEKEEGFLKSFIRFQAYISAPILLITIISNFISSSKHIIFFGNPNTLGEFIALNAINYLFFVQLCSKNREKYLGYGFYVLSFLFVLRLGARGALMGLILGTLVYFLLIDRRRFLNKIASAKVLFASALALGLSAFFIFSKGFESLHIRLAHWGNTLYLIKDMPWGVGPGNFEIQFGAYNGKYFQTSEYGERLIVGNPHNVLLEIAAEIGILGALLFFILIYRVLSSQNTKKLTTNWTWSLSATLFSLGMWAFPQDNMYALLFISLVLGLALGNSSIKNWITFPRAKIAMLALSFMTLFFVSLKAYSSYLTTLYPLDTEKYLNAACAVDKENWQACLGLAEYYLSQKNIEAASKQLNSVEERFPDFFMLLKVRHALRAEVGDLAGACKDAKLFNSYYRNKSSLDPWIKNSCSP